MTQKQAVRKYDTKQVQPAFTRDDNSVCSALWAVIDCASGVILRYGEESKVKATAERWNNNPQLVPSKLQDKAGSAHILKEMLKPGDTVQTILRHVSRSGMMRHISVIFNGQDITWHVANVLDEKRADDGGIKQGGCGMDMGFHLIYNLGSALWPFGTEKPHGTRNGEPDRNGGYALRQSWL